MRVAFVNQPYDRVVPPGQNSIGLIVYNTALELAGRVEVTVFGKERFNLDGAGPLAFEFRGVRAPRDDLMQRLVRDYPNWARRLRLEGLSDAHPQFVRSVRRGLDEVEPDIVHVMNYWNWSRALGGRKGRALVLEMQCEWLSQKDARAVAKQLSYVDAVVGVSEHITNLFRRRFPDYAGLVATSYNGVDVDIFRPSQEPDDGSERAPTVLFVGRLSTEKGVHTLLEAFARVLKVVPEARLELIGPRTTLPSEMIIDISEDPLVRDLKRFYDGRVATDYQRYLDETVARLGIGDSVRFVGPVHHAGLVARYQRAALVVNPSLSESFGISVVEGMACGLPVVATQVGGMAETVVDGETGLLVEPEQPESLADAIVAVLTDRERARRMGRLGRARAVANYTWSARAGRLLDVYRTLQKRR